MNPEELPVHDLSARAADRIRRRARAALRPEGRVARVFRERLEPAFATAAVAVYLVWLAGTIATLAPR